MKILDDGTVILRESYTLEDRVKDLEDYVVLVISELAKLKQAIKK